MPELKAEWRRVKFGEVVRQVKDRVDPEASGLERFVAGEHMDTDDLTIRRWGNIGDGYLGPAFHMRFSPGHVLYGSRRTYLRKVAVANFAGVCANTTFVLESANPDVLLPNLLPFIMQTEAFHEHSRRESRGSVNPYVNFSDLAWYEFPLPPLMEQHRLVRLLSALSCNLDGARRVEKCAREILAALLREFYPINSKDLRPLRDWCDDVITYGIVQAGPDTPGGVPYVRVSDMSEGFIDPDKVMRTSPKIAAKYGRSRVDPGDLVVALRGPIGLAVALPPELAGANLTQGTARVSVRIECSTDYVRWALGSPSIQHRIAGLAKGSTFKEISLAGLRELGIPWIPVEEQERVAEQLNEASRSATHAQERVGQTQALFRFCLADTLGHAAA